MSFENKSPGEAKALLESAVSDAMGATREKYKSASGVKDKARLSGYMDGLSFAHQAGQQAAKRKRTGTAYAKAYATGVQSTKSDFAEAQKKLEANPPPGQPAGRDFQEEHRGSIAACDWLLGVVGE
jgi:hypothetical protein